VRVGTAGAVEFIELVLRKKADLEALGAHDLPCLGGQAAGQQLGERRLAVAVLTEQRDAVVAIDAQGQPPQHRRARDVADRNTIKGDDRR
jgi:hypothetical protein